MTSQYLSGLRVFLVGLGNSPPEVAGGITHHGKAPAGIDEPGGVRIEPTRDRIDDGHLAQRVYDVEHHDADDQEVDQQRAGTARRQGAARADVEARTYRTTDGDHVQVPRLHGAVELNDAVAVVARLEAVEAQAQAGHQGLLGDGMGGSLVLMGRRGRAMGTCTVGLAL